MKKICILFLATFITGIAFSQQIKTPAPSPTVNIKQDFALSSIELSYSRPGVKNRKIFGDLVPYGKLWRTGANSATTITFGDDVIIDGKKIKAGKYGLLSIPNENEWTIILTNQLDVTNPAAYKQEQDVVMVTVKPQIIPFSVENFTILINSIKDNSCDLVLIWDNVMVSVPISTDIDSKVMAQIDNAMNNDNRPYFQAAAYYLANNKDLNKALDWFNKAEAQNPKAYYVIYQKAKCLAKLNRKQEAIDAANKSIALAKEAKNDDYVKLNEDLIKSLQ